MSDTIDYGINVMIIDDQRTMRSIIRQLLHKSHIDNVTEAENGEHALKIMAEPDFVIPDVILCDLHMDKMDGMDFTQHIRRGKNPAISEIPILILTGDSDNLLHDVTQQVGATKILLKPISAGDLLIEIQQAIGFSGIS